MPKIDLSFHGSLQGANVTQANNVNGEAVDVREMPAHELAEKLENGDLFISLGDYLYSGAGEIIMEDFAATPVWPDEA